MCITVQKNRGVIVWGALNGKRIQRAFNLTSISTCLHWALIMTSISMCELWIVYTKYPQRICVNRGLSKWC